MGSLVVVAIVVLRIYLGWSYIGDRLMSAAVEYEETGGCNFVWAGGVWGRIKRPGRGGVVGFVMDRGMGGPVNDPAPLNVDGRIAGKQHRMLARAAVPCLCHAASHCCYISVAWAQAGMMVRSL